MTLLLRSPAETWAARPPHHDPIGRKEPELPAGFDHLPSALVHQPVVVEAEQDQVGEIAWSAARPGNNVMRRGPVDRPVAAWKPAALVSDPQRPPPWSRVNSRPPADVDHHRAGEQHARDGGVAPDSL